MLVKHMFTYLQQMLFLTVFNILQYTRNYYYSFKKKLMFCCTD